MPGKLKVTQVKSTISHIARNRATIKALGLHGIGSTVEVADNDATRGMVRQVRFLVTVEAVPGSASGSDAGVAGSHRGRTEPTGEKVSPPKAASTRAGGSRSRPRTATGGGGTHAGRDAGAEEKA